MQLIRPLYLVREKDIMHWAEYNRLKFLQCACKFTEEHYSSSSTKEDASKRKKIKKLIASLAKDDPQIEYNIFKSVENVNLSTIISYKDKQNNKHHFLDDFK